MCFGSVPLFDWTDSKEAVFSALVGVLTTGFSLAIVFLFVYLRAGWFGNNYLSLDSYPGIVGASLRSPGPVHAQGGR